MRSSKLLAKVRDGKPARICGLGHFIPAYIRMAATAGFDCIWLDGEHRCFTDREIQAVLTYFHLYDIDCMFRPPTTEKTRLYRYLEDGATGLMIPHVSTPEKARMLVDAVKFPPVGDRGMDGAGLDSEFFLDGGESYVEEANRETFLVVQIETSQALENLDAIASIEGVDGLFVGPGDLGLRIQRLKERFTLDEAIRKVADVAGERGVAWGCPAASADHVQELCDMGAKLVAYGSEFFALMQMLEVCSRDLDGVYGDGS